MNKLEFIERYGEYAYERYREQTRRWQEANPEKMAEQRRRWREANPDKVIEQNHDQCRKDGRRYEKELKYNQTGLRNDRNIVRSKHRKQYKRYKNIIAPDSQIHHSWRVGTAEYSGLALVETAPHMHGIIDVIQILDGEITVFTEEEVRNRGGIGCQ